MYERDHIEDEDAYQESFDGEWDSERELDFGDSLLSAEPSSGLYESLEEELEGAINDSERTDDPFIDDLMVDENDVTTQARVDFDFDQFEVAGEQDGD